MTNRSDSVARRLARGPRNGALLAALLTLAILLPLWLLAINWYRTELLNGDPAQRSLLIFEVGGLIVMLLLAGLVYLSVNRQAALRQAVQQRTHEITRINQQLADDLAGRQRMEEELRRSDERYRALARSFPNGAVFLFDADLRYTLADGAGLADVGLSKEMLEGLTIWEALPPDTVQIIEPHYRAALAGEPHVFEAAFGGRVYVSRTLPLRDERGHILAGMAVTQDITETKQAEAQREAALAALRASESRSQALLNAIPDLMFRLDRAGNFLDYHAEADDMVLPPEAVIGGNLRQLPGEASVVERMLEKVAAALDTQQIQTLEYSLPTAGGLKDFEARMVADGPSEVVAIVRDITERQRAEQSLHRWAHMFEHAEWGVAIGSADGRTLEMMNPAYARMHGFTVEELLRQPINSVFAPGTADELTTLIRTANETGHAVMESMHVRKDGTLFPVQVDLTAVKDAQGNLLYRVANVQDISERKRAEAQLRTSEAELRALFAAMPDVILVLDDQGRYLRIAPTNPSFSRRPDDNLIGQSLADVFPPDQSAEFMNMIQTALRTQQPVQADYSLSVDGELVWYTATISPMPNDTVLLVARDITERKQSEEALRASEARNRALVNAIPDLMLRMSRDGVYLDVHADRASSWNIPPEAMIGLNIRDMPLDRELVDAFLRTNELALQTGTVQTLEYSVAWPGGMRHYEGRNVANGTSEVVVIVRDITERKQAEEALRHSQQQYEQLVNSIDGIVWEGDAQTGLFTFVSPAAQRILGYPVASWLNDPNFWVERLHPEDRSWVVAYCAAETAALRPHECDYRMLAVDGRSVWLRETVTVMAEGDRPKVLRGLMIDITDRKQVEEALREREEQYRSIFEASLDGLFINSLDGRIVDVNPAGARMHGYTVEECRGLRSEWLVPPDRLAGLQEFLNTAREAGQFRARGFDLRQDGTPFPVDILGTQFIYRGEPHALAIVRDITEQVKVETTLNERELQYRSVFESSLDGLAINTLDGQLVEFNPAMAHMHGYTVDEFRQIQPMQFIHPDSQLLFVDYMATVKTGREYRCRALDVRKDGSTFHVEVVGTPFTLRGEPHAFAIVRDISAQVEAEQLLEQRVAERTRELSTLLDVSRNVASTLEIEPLLGLILDALKVFVNYTSARINTLEGSSLRVRAARGANRLDRAIGAEFSLSGLVAEEVLIHRRVLVIPDLTSQTDPWARTFHAEGPANIDAILVNIRSWMGVPLIARGRVIGNLSLEHDQAGFYDAHHAEVVLALADQVAVALENARLFTEAQGKAVLEERQRLARDLHDSVTQSLYSLTLLAEAGRRLIKADALQAEHYLSDMGEIAQQSLKEMRLLVYQLRPLALEHEGLIGALQARLDSVEKRAGVEARFLIEGSLGSLPSALEEGLFRVAQEALNNALKHAAARSVVVRLRGNDHSVTLEVADDGRGSALLNHAPTGGLGVTSMQERAAQLGGRILIDSAPGQGTRVTVEVPRPGQSDAPLAELNQGSNHD